MRVLWMFRPMLARLAPRHRHVRNADRYRKMLGDDRWYINAAQSAEFGLLFKDLVCGFLHPVLDYCHWILSPTQRAWLGRQSQVLTHHLVIAFS